MPVRRHGKGWEVRVQHAGVRFGKTVRDRKDAFALERQWRERIADNTLGRVSRYSLEEALTRWLTGEASALKSAQDVREKVRTIFHLVQGRALAEVVDVAELVKSEGMKAGAAAATINRKLAALRRVANLAYRQWGWLDKPLGDRIRLLPGERQRTVFLDPVDVARLARKAPSRPVRDAILLAAMTGLRRGEILSLTPASRRDEALFLPDTKSGKPRMVPLPPEALNIRLPIGISKHVLKHGFEDARAAAGLEHVRFHDLRRCYGTWLHQRGANLAAIRDLLGHSNISVTSRYLSASSSDLAAAVKLLPPITGSTRGRGKRKKVA